MKEGFESLGRIRLQGLTLVALAFIAGGLGGVALERVRASKQAAEAAPAIPGFPRPGMFRPGQIPPPFRRLNLTAEQETQIKAILEEARPMTDSILGEMMPRLRAATESTRQQILAVLTAEQAEQLDSIMQSFRHGGRSRREGSFPRRGRVRQPDDGSG